MNEQASIEPLTKVTLALQATPDDENFAEPADRCTFEFVCGLAIEGLTSFEQALSGMTPGDQIRLRIEAPGMSHYFEHLHLPLLAAVRIEPPYELNIEVLSVVPVSDRELVKALAKKTENSGCGCGAGCSCG